MNVLLNLRTATPRLDISQTFAYDSNSNQTAKVGESCHPPTITFERIGPHRDGKARQL